MRRVVITGVGILAPNGLNKEQYWKNCNAGISYTERDQEMVDLKFKSSVLCRIKNFNLEDHISLVDYPEVADLDEFVQYGVSAGEQAVKDAGLEKIWSGERAGAIFSSAIGGTPTIVKLFSDMTDQGKRDLYYKPVGKRFYDSGMFNYPAVLLAQKHNVSGLVTSVTTGCTAGLDALGMCFNQIRQGKYDVMLAGASEAPLTALTYATLDVINSLATFDGDPKKASRPFESKRSGFVISEGAVVLALEEREHAIARGATIYAEVKGFGSVSNAFHMTDLPSHGLPMAKAIKGALDDAAITPDRVKYINAHGSSTPQNDVFETGAYKEAFGPHAYDLAISSVKSMIGHSLSSASLMGTVSTIGAIFNHVVHPTINFEEPDPACDLDYVPNVAREMVVDYGMVTASGFGGIHSAGVLCAHE